MPSGQPQAQVVRKSGLVRCALVCLPGLRQLRRPLPNYITRVWTTDDGLPGSSVMNVIQSHDGYLWVGTYSGLARFDGVHFTVFDGGNTPEMQART
jgi:ligand-binding sensor domain-containing protein